MGSIRFSSRARIGERGGAVVAALALSVLYFALISLLLIDSSRELGAARRFRARVVAAAAAETAAELAAEGIVSRQTHKIEIDGEAGQMSASMRKKGNGEFEIEASAVSPGLVKQKAWVRVYGRVERTAVRIDYTTHSQ